MVVEWSHEDGIGRVVLSDPPLNILSRQMMSELREAFHELNFVDDLRVLILEAEGKHFSAGADVGEHLPPEYESMIPEFLKTIRVLYDFPLPVLAAVRGRCLGGGFELVQAVDLIVAGESASFGQPEIMLAVIPPAACALLPELVGPALAAELVLTGDAVDAREALEAGLVARVVEDDDVAAETAALAGRMARHSAAALRSAKKALHAGNRGHVTAALTEAGRIYNDELMKTEDAVEGLQAFMEKRQAKWTHR